MRFAELMRAIALGSDRDCIYNGINADSVDTIVNNVTTDSRRVRPDTLFIALRGGKSDGHSFIPQAIESGAAAVILEDESFVPARCVVPHIVCPDIRGRLPRLAVHFYGSPTRSLTVIGVTGTNGKTSTTYYLKAILEAAGIPTGLIGTIEHIIGSEREAAANTTPDALKLQELFARMLAAGMRAAVMEVSSHGLALGRTEGIEFDGAIFTNITEDHLDFHKTMEDYLAAKLLFADQLEGSVKSNKWYCCNRDIQYGGTVKARLRRSGLPIWYFGAGDGGETEAHSVTARGAAASLDETSYMLCHGEAGLTRVELASRGYFNIYNSLAAASAALALGIAPEIIARGMAEVRIPGRFELVPNDRGFLVAVDYAHTDDALANLLSSARRLDPKRIITVFGCGGDRDRAKRPRMARAASSLSDMVIVTSDNPRTENPDAIIQDILPGIVDSGRARVVPDRAEAIRAALHEAQKGDIVLIAGKGHENYQIFADRTIHFDDREAAAEALAAL
jgi:UDP-N-acetylmuramoyl-L-alanyl-D-glutamate--2,6-diaminopimelate ligase